MGKKWLPLESNPDVFNDFAAKLGMQTQLWSFGDVYGLDPDLLAMVPRPTLALIMLFPITPDTEEAKKQEEEQVKAQGQTVSKHVYFTKQTIGNACGTVALLHTVGNNLHVLSLAPGSFLRRFFEDTHSMTPEERAAYLEDPPADAPSMDEAHANAAAEGQTAAPSVDDDINLHFVALTTVEGHLYELDGRKAFPINHGPTSEDTFLEDAAQVVQAFIQKSKSTQFSLLSLGAAQL